MAKMDQPTIEERRFGDVRVCVIDGMFDAGMVAILHESFRRLPFKCDEYDTEETRHLPHWKFEFDLAAIDANPLLRNFRTMICAQVECLYPDRRLSLQRIHCNNHAYGDQQNAHQDIARGVTALYIANAAWQDDWWGETLFYDERGEPVLAVAPKPGRVILFAGEIVHRGGVPSRLCFEQRLSVAFKFAAEAVTGQGQSGE
ncbi:MAG: 2OG-Fe(II) oxygenase [Novosphingobium sp.]